jgi:hypothetical protein
MRFCIGLPSGTAFTAGQRQLLVLSFQIATNLTAVTNLAVGFGNQPVAQEVGSVNADVLPVQFVGGVVAVTPSYEADVSPRFNGDGRLTGTDYTLIGRFVAGLSTISNANEFARADCAPRAIPGNGMLSGTDWTQAGRYVVGLDAPQLAGGPMAPTFGPPSRQPKDALSGPVLRLVGGAAVPGGQMTMPLELAAMGDENTLAFSVVFDPLVFRYDAVTYGTGLIPSAQLLLNTSGVSAGRLACCSVCPPGQRLLRAPNKCCWSRCGRNHPLQSQKLWSRSAIPRSSARWGRSPPKCCRRITIRRGSRLEPTWHRPLGSLWGRTPGHNFS